MNMNAVEFTNDVRRAEPSESPVIGVADESRLPARNKLLGVRLAAYTLLAGFVLSIVWMVLAINRSLDQINEQLDMPHPTFTRPVSN